jgi:hypothetical protein
MLTTPRGFRYPELLDSPDVPRDIGNLASDIDGMFTSSTLGLRPAAGKIGRVHYATDTDTFSRDLGTAWVDAVHKSYLDFTAGRSIFATQDITAASGNSGQVKIGNYGTSYPSVTFGTGAGADTNLYRAGANYLKTDDDFASALSVAASAGTVNQVQVGGGTVPVIYFGSAADTNLYRAGADLLKTDDTFYSAANIYANQGAAGQIGLESSGGVAQIVFGSARDVDLYRSAGDLKTDNTFRSAQGIFAGTGTAQQVAIGNVGPGSTAGIIFGSSLDASIYRQGANDLRTASQFVSTQEFVARNASAYQVNVGFASIFGGAAAVQFGATQDANIGRAAAGVVGTTGDFASRTVTSLPGAPVDGQEINYVADSANGIIWKLKYRAASASAYKWEFVGGSSLDAYVDAGENYAGVGYGNAATVGPSVTVPLAGNYDVTLEFAGSGPSGEYGRMAFMVGASAATDADAVELSSPNTASIYDYTSVSRTRRNGPYTAGTVLKAQYHSGGAAFTFKQRRISIRPTRVG